MKTTRKVCLFAVLALAFLTMGGLVSCNHSDSNDEEIEVFQERLNSLMAEYDQIKVDYDVYKDSLKTADSIILAQAAEIQNLINQLKAAKAAAARPAAQPAASTADIAALAKQEAELKAKQKQIESLEEQLARQTEQLAQLEAKVSEGLAGEKTIVSNDDRTTIERLQKQLASQNRMIANLTNEKVVLVNRNDSLAAQMAAMVATGAKGANNESENLEYAARIAQLQKQVNDQRNEIANLQAEVASQMSLVSEAQDKAREAIAEAEHCKADAAKAAEAFKQSEAQAKGAVNKKLNELQNLCDQYLAEIERLRAENEQLTEENTMLRTQVTNLQDEAEQTAVANAKLAVKVSRAAILVTQDVQAIPVKRVGSSGKETNRASATDGLRISGTILDNHVVDPGTITLYARLTDPNNRVITNGSFEEYSFDADGVRTMYTTAIAIEFTGETRTFEMAWAKDPQIELTPGIYKLAIYANGNVIGTTTFRLK